jgi:hypothetical protein
MSKLKGEISGPFERWTWKCVQCPNLGFGYGSKEDAEKALREHNKEDRKWHKYLRSRPKSEWTSAPPKFM